MSFEEILAGWCATFPMRRLAPWEFSEIGLVQFEARGVANHRELLYRRYALIDKAKDRLLGELDQKVRESMDSKSALLVHCTPVVEVSNGEKEILFCAWMKGWKVPRAIGLQVGVSINREVGRGHKAWRRDASESFCVRGPVKLMATPHPPSIKFWRSNGESC